MKEARFHAIHEASVDELFFPQYIIDDVDLLPARCTATDVTLRVSFGHTNWRLLRFLLQPRPLV